MGITTGKKWLCQPQKECRQGAGLPLAHSQKVRRMEAIEWLPRTWSKLREKKEVRGHVTDLQSYTYVTLEGLRNFLWHNLRNENRTSDQVFGTSTLSYVDEVCPVQHRLGELFPIWLRLHRLLTREFHTRWRLEANFMGVNWNWQRAISNSLLGVGVGWGGDS